MVKKMKSIDIINNMVHCFRVETYKCAATQEDIEKLKIFSTICVPEDYLEIVRVMTDVEILVNDNYVRIWGASRCVEMNEAYQVKKYIPNSLAIGDNEGGMALIIMNGAHGYGLYTVGFGDLDADDAMFIAPSLYEFLVDGKGVEFI